MSGAPENTSIERVQLGVRMEKSMVKVLKGLAEYEELTLGQLLEKIVLHSFEPLQGEEGEWSASPLGKRSLAAVEDLKRVYGMTYDMHAFRRFPTDDGAGSEDAADARASNVELTFKLLKGHAVDDLLRLRDDTPRTDLKGHYAIRRALRANGYFISKNR